MKALLVQFFFKPKSFNSLDICNTIIFNLILGQLDKAQQLCIKVGQPWRAATLEGWKLFHDPNYERDNADEKLPVEGNKNRDIWLVR